MLTLSYTPKAPEDDPGLSGEAIVTKFGEGEFYNLIYASYAIFEESGEFMCEICMN